jgi:glycosyltransferase involved in cell wall biosynthesis
MRILFVHNSYAKPSGEEHMIYKIMDLLRSHNHVVEFYSENSSDIKDNLSEKSAAFFKGIYSTKAKNSIYRVIRSFMPDIVQIQNLYPLISSSILPKIKNAGIPIVMRLANYRLVCPNGLLLSQGKPCTKCAGGREWWCILKNCEAEIPKSIGYALRSWVSRIFKLYQHNVTCYYAQTKFQRHFFIGEGIADDRIDVIPNMIKPNGFDDINIGEHVSFAGRLSPEKGVDTFINAAYQCPELYFSMAGDFSGMHDALSMKPSNLEVLGHLFTNELELFYSNARLIVVPSLCYEGFPSTIIEAMNHGKPVICSRIGGLPEIVDEGRTGFLFEPNNTEDLANKIRYLYHRPDLCLKMGQAGKKKVLNEYSPDKYYERLMNIYRKAIQLNKTLHHG